MAGLAKNLFEDTVDLFINFVLARSRKEKKQSNVDPAVSFLSICYYSIVFVYFLNRRERVEANFAIPH